MDAILNRISAMAMVFVVGLFSTSISDAFAKELSAMGRDEILTLQRRLTDASCYKGALDGDITTELENAIGSCPDQEPVLSIETGAHTNNIQRVSVDTMCRIAATASGDKTVRLWSLSDGRLLRTQRVPIGGGYSGQVYAVAMSPDGRQVAAGGSDASSDRSKEHGVYLFDSATGTSVRRIGKFEGNIMHLSFSRDGNHLAVALADGRGIRVLDVQSGRELMADRDYAGTSSGVTFGAGGTLYAAGRDGYIRRYGPDLKRTAKAPTNSGKEPYSVAVDPGGQHLAVGYRDVPSVDIFDAVNLRHIVQADSNGMDNGDLRSVAWAANGSLVAGGRYFNSRIDQRNILRWWDPDGRQRGADMFVVDNTISSLVPCGNAIAYGASEPGLAYPDGRVVPFGSPVIADMRSKLGDSFIISADGARVKFGLGTGAKRPVLFDLNAETLLDAGNASSELYAADVTSLKVVDWQDRISPKLNGQPIPLDRHERSRSLAVRGDRTGFVLGAEWSLRGVDAEGRERWRQQTSGISWGVNLARSGDLVVNASDDGTVRWYRWSDGKELLALFVHRIDKRWVAWTPTGYYMASPGAEELIGWHVNRGWEQPADFFPAARLRERFNRPDIVKLVLGTLDEDAAVKHANDRARRRENTKSVAAQLPPVLRITSPAEGTRFATNEVAFSYEWRSPSGLALDKVEVLIDGRPLAARGFDRLQAPAAGSAPRTATISITLPARDVEVALVARSGDLFSEPARVRLTWVGGDTRGSDLLKPKLYALVIGVSNYKEPGLKLGYAAKDARDFAKALEGQKDGMYSSVETRLITDSEVTRATIIRGLKWLEQQVTSRDIGIVFLAGHGVADRKNTYWFLPFDATPEEVDISAVSQDDIKRTLQNLAGKALLFLDTCHAGQALTTTERRRSAVDINAVVNELAAAENGVVAFASSTGRQVSVERDDWQNGAFTKALIEGLLDGRADLLGKGIITISQLDAFVVNRVKELTGGTQHPVMTRPSTVPDFPIALRR